MSEEKKNKESKEQSGSSNPPAPTSRIVQLDTTKAGLRKYLDKAAEKTGESFHAGKSLRRAAITFAADCAGLQGEERAAFAKVMDATPGWFLCGNNSACRQSYEAKGTADEISKEYADY